LAAKVRRGLRGDVELVLVNAAATLLEGDRLTVYLVVGPGSTLAVRSVAAQLAHPCPGGGSTSLSIRAEVCRGGHLDWAPEPLVACGGCRHESDATVVLAPTATVLWR
jgi:urease accessory protein